MYLLNLLFYGQDIRIDFSILLSIYDMCAEPLWGSAAAFPPRMAFFHWFLPFVVPLEFAFSLRLW